MHVAEARSHTRPVPSALPVMAKRPSASTSAQFTCSVDQASAEVTAEKQSRAHFGPPYLASSAA